MEHLWIVRFIWISIMIISIFAMTENVTRNPCRPIGECLDEIQSNSKNSEFVAIFSPCESSDRIMIKCCTFLHMSINDLSSCASQNTLKEQIKYILHDTLKIIYLINPFEQTKHVLLMMRKSASKILPPSVNSVQSKYIGLNDATELKSTESYNSKEITMKTNRVQSIIANAIYSNDFERETDVTITNLIDDFPKKIMSPFVRFVKTDAHSSFIPVENVKYVWSLRDNIDSNLHTPKQEIYIDEHKKYSPHVRQLIKATNVERIYPENHSSNALKGRLTSTTTSIDNARINLDINNRRGVTEELLEFDGNVDETNARYEKQSMVSSSMSKDVHTTPAVNSFEQKTSSETFLSLDRISTQPINKTTLTNKSEAPRNDGDTNVFTIVKRSPSFSRNAQENKQFAIRKINSRLIRDSPKREKTNWNHREFSLIENTTIITPISGRDDPLQASTRNKRMTAPLIVPQKDVLNKNTEEAEYKNNTAQKKNTKPLLQNQSEVTFEEDKRGSTGENATKDSADVTTATLPVRKFRFPPKFLPARFKPQKEERNSTTNPVDKFQNLNRFSSSRFQHFYEAKEGLLSKINNMTVFRKIKPTRFEFFSNASQVYLIKKKNEMALKNSKAKNYALDIKTPNVSALNDSTSINKNDSFEYSAPNLQDASLTSSKITSHLNMSSSQKIEKSMQTETMYNNDTASYSTLENNSKVSSEAIVQKITENLKQLSDINRANAHQKYLYSTESSIDKQLNRNKTEIARPSESSSSSLSVNAANE